MLKNIAKTPPLSHASLTPLAFSNDAEHLLLFGGVDQQHGASAEAWMLQVFEDPPLLTPIKPASGIPPRFGHCAFPIMNTEALLIWGGVDGKFFSDLALLSYDSQTWQWHTLKQSKTHPSARAFAAGVAVPHSSDFVASFWVFGGLNDDGPCDDAWQLDLKRITAHRIDAVWKRLDIPITPVWGHSAALLSSRFIVLFGGWEEVTKVGGEYVGASPTSSLIVVDTSDGQMQLLSFGDDRPPPRALHTASMVGPWMLVAGGADDASPILLFNFGEFPRLVQWDELGSDVRVEGIAAPIVLNGHSACVMRSGLFIWSTSSLLLLQGSPPPPPPEEGPSLRKMTPSAQSLKKKMAERGEAVDVPPTGWRSVPPAPIKLPDEESVDDELVSLTHHRDPNAKHVAFGGPVRVREFKRAVLSPWCFDPPGIPRLSLSFNWVSEYEQDLEQREVAKSEAGVDKGRPDRFHLQPWKRALVVRTTSPALMSPATASPSLMIDASGENLAAVGRALLLTDAEETLDDILDSPAPWEPIEPAQKKSKI